jgi:ABC-type uncharacterized transport system substrate-binding protein
MYRLDGGSAQQSVNISLSSQFYSSDTRMLVDQKNSNILPLICESLESLFNGCIVGLAVNY